MIISTDLSMNIITILSKTELEDAMSLVKKLSFIDGKQSANGLAKAVKSNLEADRNDESFIKAISYLNQRFRSNEKVKQLFLPEHFSSPIINKAMLGGGYGKHFDASHMHSSKGLLKSDFSFTLMLSSQEDYEGGELEIDTGEVKKQFKIAAGEAVIYPSNTIHQVLPVTSGERIAYIGWITSNFKNYAAFEAMKEFEEMHVRLLKHSLSDDEQLKIAFVKNRLRHVLTK